MCDDETVVTLTANDGVNVEIAYKYVKVAVTVKNLVDDVGADNPIPLPNVSGEALRKLVDYLIYHGEHPVLTTETPVAQPVEGQDGQAAAAPATPTTSPQAEENAKWDAEYLKMELPKLFELILAANYMDVKPLLDLTCKSVANMIKGKTPEQIREIFGIENDFTPEEEEQVRQENAWCEA